MNLLFMFCSAILAAVFEMTYLTITFPLILYSASDLITVYLMADSSNEM